MTAPVELSRQLISRAVDAALDEDLGLRGDITSTATIPADARATATIAARRNGVVAGIGLAEYALRALDPDIEFRIMAGDGDRIAAGSPIAHVAGNARAILGAERVALNFLGHLSGIATLTSAYVAAVEGTGATIVDTRKTTPGLRALEKYAVRCGGGQNHRFGLFDAVLIKDNHIIAAGGLSEAIKRARAAAGHMVKIEVEVDTLEQLREVVTHPIDAVLLDNMSPEMLKEAVAIASGRVLLEASGGVNLDTVRDIARTGVDLISVGALTHSAPVLDLGLDMDIPRFDKP